MSNKKVLIYSVSGRINDIDWIDNYEATDNITEAQIVVFPGGADVNPDLYGFREHPATYTSRMADERDIAALKAMKPNQLAVGICRGAQFLCVANGGKLIQDVHGHALGYTHEVVEYDKLYGAIKADGKKLQTSSLHHQMMYPYNLQFDDYDLLYVSFVGRDLSGLDLSKDGKRLRTEYIKSYGEPEVVLFHKGNNPKCLAIQGHPEMMRHECTFVKEMNNIINNLLNK